MNFPSVLYLLLFAVPAFTLVESKNILFFQLLGSASHRSSIWPLAASLADAGHNVTYIYPFHRRPGSHPKVEEVAPSKLVETMEGFYDTCEINLLLNHTMKKFMLDNMLKAPQFCANFYDSPETKDLLTQPDRKYDLILINGAFSQCAYGLVHHFKAKHIVFHPVMGLYVYESFGVVPESSSVPDFLFHPTTTELRTSLWSRTMNAIVAPFVWRAMFLYSMGQMEAVTRDKMQIYDSSNRIMPSFPEFEHDTSLILHNNYFLEDYPLSLPPLFISYSGLWCSKKERSNRKALPVEMESFVNNADSTGFVYISFGSAVHVHNMPTELRNQFMAMFRAFPNLKFLWKWNGPVPEDTPKNVLLNPWFPQTDVLAHPKIKAFMTQVGRPSTQEALCYGVPIIAVPAHADQFQNAQRLVEHGAAILLDFMTLSNETMIAALRQITETDSYRNAAVDLSTLFRDRPIDPLENVLYWVEYALKYNTTLLQPLGMKQPWWQRRLLDVYALVATILLIILLSFLFFAYLITKCVTKLCTSSKTKSSTVTIKKKAQ